MLKMAALAPMPIAIVATVMAVKPGERSRARRTWRSCWLYDPTRFHTRRKLSSSQFSGGLTTPEFRRGLTEAARFDIGIQAQEGYDPVSKLDSSDRAVSVHHCCVV